MSTPAHLITAWEANGRWTLTLSFLPGCPSSDELKKRQGGHSLSAPWADDVYWGDSADARYRRPRRLRRFSEEAPINWFLWAAVAFATLAVVLFTMLWIDASRGTHTDDRRGAAGATLLAWCMGVATVLGIIGLVVKFW